MRRESFVPVTDEMGAVIRIAHVTGTPDAADAMMLMQDSLRGLQRDMERRGHLRYAAQCQAALDALRY